MSVRVFVGKNQSSVKKQSAKKICHWQKNSWLFADSVSSDKVFSQKTLS